MIFFDQFKVPTIKFGKCFAEFMIPIALLKKFIDFLKLQKFKNKGKIRIFYPNFVWLEIFCFVLGLGVEN